MVHRGLIPAPTKRRVLTPAQKRKDAARNRQERARNVNKRMRIPAKTPPDNVVPLHSVSKPTEPRPDKASQMTHAKPLARASSEPKPMGRNIKAWESLTAEYAAVPLPRDRQSRNRSDYPR